MLKLCPGGCGARIGHNRRWCPACSPQTNPQWRAERARRAQQAAKEVYRQRALERAAGLTPAAAYTKGYISGYNLAYRYWKRWAEQAIRRNKAA